MADIRELNRSIKEPAVATARPSPILRPPPPPLPDAADIRSAAERVRVRRERGELVVTESPVKNIGSNPEPITVKPAFSPPGQGVGAAQPGDSPALPDDFEAGLKNLEATLRELNKAALRIQEGVVLATTQIAHLRARAVLDVERLARLEVIEKALTR